MSKEPTWATDFKKDFWNQFSEFKDDLKQQNADMKEQFQTLFDKYNEKIEEVKSVAEDAISKTEKLAEDFDTLQSENDELKHEISFWKNRVINLEAQSRRENLIFQSVQPDAPTETWASAETKVRNLLRKHRICENEEILIERAHRLGYFKPGKCRPIIVKFSFYKTRDCIWRERTKLQGSNIFIAEDYPKEILEKRNVLCPILRAAQNEIAEKK
jgi:FtsZ-binding cell division protein ZapB